MASNYNEYSNNPLVEEDSTCSAGKVFISYSSKEKDIAFQTCQYLETHGIPCWIAPRDIDAGSNYISQIVNAIKSCELFVLMASEHTNSSGHVSNEVGMAFHNKKIVIAFKIHEFNFSDEYLYFLGRQHWIEARGDIDAGLKTLKDSILSRSPLIASRASSINTDSAATGVAKNSVSHLMAPHLENSRSAIVKCILNKAKKYPHCIIDRVDTEEKFTIFITYACNLFRETVKVYNRNTLQESDNNLIDQLVAELESAHSSCIQVQGLPGSAKNLILQIVFLRLIGDFERGTSDVLPFYISSSYYESIPYTSDDIHSEMSSLLQDEFSEYFDYIDTNENVVPTLFISGIREHTIGKVSPENVIFEQWKKYGQFKRVSAIDVGLIKNRSRIKRVIPIAGSAKQYLLITHQVPIDDKAAVDSVIRSVLMMYDYPLDDHEVYSVLKKLKYPTIDAFLVRLVAEEILQSFDTSQIRLTDIYEKHALSELYGDEEKLKFVSSGLFKYVFDKSTPNSAVEYNGAMWLLPHKHNTYLEFLIAYYFIDRIKNYDDYGDTSFFETMLTAMSNQFVVSFLRENYSLQETLLKFITSNYEVFNIQQKSNGAYWLGRITYKSLANEAITILTKEFTKYKSIVKTNNKNTQENLNNHFVFRSVCTGLLFQGQANMMDEYLSIVVANDIANAINRGATIEYFGDNYQMVAHDVYYLDTDLSTGEQAIKILNNRIESALFDDTGKFVENNLVTMLTLLQARIQNQRVTLNFDIIPLVKKALHYIEVYKTRPQSIVSRKLLYYFKSVEEDLRLFLESDQFDIGTLMFNKYNRLKTIKRSQWASHGIEDPESVSEHSFSSWLMAMFFLPEELNKEGYNKREILDMLMVHDMAQAAFPDHSTTMKHSSESSDLSNDILRKLFLKGTYPDIANLTYYYNVWTGYYNGLNINAKTAKDINLLQSVYSFCEYYCEYPNLFTIDEVREWLNEKTKLSTDLGYHLFDRLITQNHNFDSIFKAIKS